MNDKSNKEQCSTAIPRRCTASGCGGYVGPVVGTLLVLLVIILFLLPAVVPNHVIRRRSQCSINLHNIALAILNYEIKYHRLPPAYTVDKQGRRMHSWRVLVLEFLDPDLYSQYDFSRPWNAPANLAFAKKMKKDGPYFCPSEEIKDTSWTSYVMFVGPTAFSDGPTGRRLNEIAEGDGTTNTVAVVEMSPSGILWTAPYDLNVAEMSFRINDEVQPAPRSCHSGGVFASFVDGHVEFLSVADGMEDVKEHLKALTTINGGEDTSKFNK
jgi:hypothetical protein